MRSGGFAGRGRMPRRSTGPRSTVSRRRTAAVGGDVHRYGFPRTDLQVTLDGVTIEPGTRARRLGRVQADGRRRMVMGDLVLLQSEVNPVMAKLIEGGLEVTAVHNHLLRAEPLTFYMHVGGHGDPVKMAETIHNALAVEQDAAHGHAAGRQHRPRSISTRRRSTRSSGRRATTTAASMRSTCRARDPITEQGMAVGAPIHGRRDRHQLPADRRRQGGDHRRLRAHRRRRSIRDHGAAGERHRGDGNPQPHARPRSRGSSSCTSGRTTTRSSSPRGCAPRSTRPRAPGAEAQGSGGGSIMSRLRDRIMAR